jgi:hypothetical protein
MNDCPCKNNLELIQDAVNHICVVSIKNKL